MQGEGRTADRGGPADPELRELVGEHDRRAAELELGVAEAAAGRIDEPEALGRAEHLGVPADRGRAVGHPQVGKTLVDRHVASWCASYREPGAQA
jgi:hypothetical protein